MDSLKKRTLINFEKMAGITGRMCKLRLYVFIVILVCFIAIEGFSYEIGVYYFPGWQSTSSYWNDIKGLPGSRSPGVPWPEREPLLGYYPEEETSVAEKHIEWASQYGIAFFAYDWYWSGNQTSLDHALKAHLKASNKNKLRFCLLWANHSDVPKNNKEFDDMVAYWMTNYFNQPIFYTIGGKPVIFIFSYNQLNDNAKKFGESGKSLIERANAMAIQKGYKGIYFVADTNEEPSNDIENRLRAQGYNAYSGWNYVASKDKRLVADYDSMIDTYLPFYNAAAKTAKYLPYIVSASPGWDARPWQGKNGYVRLNPTPEKFERALVGAKNLMDTQPGIPKILMIEAWNEFGEGAYIEPTKKWGMRYLETIQKVFGAKR